MGFLFREFGKSRALVMSQEELAEKSGVKVSRIKNYECGRRKAHVEDVALMCEALGVKFEDYYKQECVILTFLSNKGGSCKTTDSVNVAYTLATHYNQKVLIIDTDMQQNTGQHLKMDVDDNKNIYQALTKKESLVKHIRNTKYKNLDIVTSHDGMSTMETEMAIALDVREKRFQKILKEVKEEGKYDYIIIDTNPVLGQVNRSILFATDGVIVPLEASSFGLRGLQYLTNYIGTTKDDCEDLKILGILANNFDARKRVTREVMSTVEERFGSKELLFKTRIRTDTAIPQSQMYSEPVGVSFKKSRAHEDFVNVCEEIMSRVKKEIING